MPYICYRLFAQSYPTKLDMIYNIAITRVKVKYWSHLKYKTTTTTTTKTQPSYIAFISKLECKFGCHLMKQKYWKITQVHCTCFWQRNAHMRSLHLSFYGTVFSKQAITKAVKVDCVALEMLLVLVKGKLQLPHWEYHIGIMVHKPVKYED